MLQKEQVLSILKKYGYYSLNRAPFLYQNQENIGIYFVWPNKHYGNLERVLYFKKEEEVEEEVFKYWWYQNNKEKYSLTVVFDNYEVCNPIVNYYYKGTSLTIEMMKNFNEEGTNLKDPKDTIKKRQLLRTSTILILVLKEKLRIQNEIYLKVSEMKETIETLKKEYKKKLSLYKKGFSEAAETFELLVDNHDESEKLLKELHNELISLDSVEDIRNFIKMLFQYLEKLESSSITLQNRYLLNRYPYEIEDLRKKIVILEDALNIKKKLFQSKQDLFEQLNIVDNMSECKKMVNLKIFIEKERKQVQYKYQNRGSIDENVLGDYLVNFEKLNIELPTMIENNDFEEFDKEELFTKLKKTFDSFTEEEKSACFVASSFLRECLIVLIGKNLDKEFNISQVISKLVLDNKIHIFNDAYMALDHYTNAKIRVKYFSVIKMKSFETFMSSLIEVLKMLKNLELNLPKSFYGYYIDRNKSIVNLYLKNIVHLNKKTSYIAKFMPNVPIYYSPVSVVRQLDIINNNELVERKNDTIFFIKEDVGIKNNHKKTTVVQYEKDKISKESYFIVHSLKEKNRCEYYEDMIYNKEDGGLYE